MRTPHQTGFFLWLKNMRTEYIDHSLGQMFLKAHDIGDGHVVYSSSFLTKDHRNPYPYPDGDAYLSRLGVRVAGRGDTVMCATMLPGELDYLRALGIAQGVQVLEVTPQIKDKSKSGYPYTDPVGLLSGQVSLDTDGRPSYLITVFNNSELMTQAKELGLNTLTQPDSTITNNKANFREASTKHGYRILPGLVMREGIDLAEAADRFGNTKLGVWLKFPTGSGGDLVTHVTSVTERELLNAVASMRESVWKALAKGSFDVSGPEFWPDDKLTPERMPLVIESDARNYGKVILNGSNYFTTTRNGVITNGNFQQITTEEGEYVGSRPYSAEGDILEELNEQTRRVGAHNIMDNKYFGIQGLDFFLVKGKDGKVTVYATELNSRPPISAFADIFARKLGVASWVNINLYTQREMRNIGDFIAVVGEEMAFGKRDGSGKIVSGIFPQSFRSMPSYTREHGQEFFASPNFKALIAGQTSEECNAIMGQLAEKGIRFSPPK